MCPALYHLNTLDPADTKFTRFHPDFGMVDVIVTDISASTRSLYKFRLQAR